MGEKRVIEQIASDEIYNDDWFLKDSVLHDTTKVQPSVIKEYMNQGMATSQDLADEVTARQNMDSQLASGISKQMSNLADFYDTTKSYVVGDVVMQQSGDLLRCIAPTSGAFDITKWESVTVDELFDDLNFSAEAISYDNTSSGLEAENVQDAIDETITKLSAVGSASGDIATFTDGSDLPMPKLEVAIEPVQDLHGYDNPWVGGAGKNKAKVTNKGKDGITPLNTYNGLVQISGNEFILTPTNSSIESYFGSISFSSSSTESSFNTFYSVRIKEDAQYTFSLSNNNFDKNIIQFFDDSYNVIAQSGAYYKQFNTNTGTVTAPTGATWMVCRIGMSSGTAGTAYKTTLQIEEGSTATTFAPYSNICPISGWDEVNVSVSGKNYFNKITFTVKKFLTSDGHIVTSDDWSISDYIGVKGGTAYILSGAINTGTIAYHCFYDKSKNFISSVVSTNQNFTTPSNAYYVRLSMRTETPDAVQLEYGNTATAYEPYNGHTYTIDLDGTRYGGTLDVVSGVLTVDRVSITVDENSNIISESGGLPFRIDLLTGAKASSSASALTGVKCNFLKEVAQSSSWGVNGTFSRVTLDAKSVYFKVNSEITTTQQLKTFLQSNNLQFVYELATPITYQLTPTVVKSLSGMNNISADCGEVLDAEYIRDLTTIIDYILEQLNA